MTKTKEDSNGGVLGISHLFWASHGTDSPQDREEVSVDLVYARGVEDTVEVGPFLTTLGRLLCGIPFGHNYETAREPKRIFLRCINCGEETQGWDLHKEQKK